MKGIIKYGFLIDGKKIYDTHRNSYYLKKKYVDGNLMCELIPDGYKRLYEFEPLLHYYHIDYIFSILKRNSILKRKRVRAEKSNKKLKYVIYNLPTIRRYSPQMLTKRKFEIYKICQKLLKLTN